MHDVALRDFAQARPSLTTLAAELERTLRDQLVTISLPLHSVTSRVKSPDSLAKKLARPDKTYAHLWDVTDLVGLRITTWFEDAIDDVARHLEANWKVDFRHSTDKQRFTNASHFGYRSLHYVCAHEAGPHPAFRFEIQVRTVLQHAWAEVEHDLGYKADAVPEAIRRRFNRVASLLEVADQEFVAIRQALVQHQHTLKQALSERSPLPLDGLTLAALSSGPEVDALDARLASALGRPRSDQPWFPEYLVKLLSLSGLATTTDVLDAARATQADLERLVPRYFDFAQRHLGLDRERLEVPRGYSLFFVAHAAVLSANELILGKVARLTMIYQQLDGLDERRAHELASGLVSAFTR